MVRATFNYSMTIGGSTLTGQVIRNAEGQITQEIALPAARTGSLTARTDNDTGEVTLGSGHGIVSTDVVDVYWSGGQRIGMVATVTGNVAAVDGGTGSNLPTTTTAVTLSKQVVADCDFSGDLLSALAMACPQRCNVRFTANNDTVLLDAPIATAEAYAWISGTGPANPLVGVSVGKLKVSNASTTAATLAISILYDSVT